MHRLLMCVFFFKQKTAYEMRISDWSSDVCSSDLFRVAGVAGREVELAIVNCGASAYPDGWPGYKARYSEDRDNWLLADTGYADGTLTIRLSPDSHAVWRSEEHTSELQALMRISYDVSFLKKKKKRTPTYHTTT